jgi:hypothetical protein
MNAGQAEKEYWSAIHSRSNKGRYDLFAMFSKKVVFS